MDFEKSVKIYEPLNIFRPRMGFTSLTKPLFVKPLFQTTSFDIDLLQSDLFQTNQICQRVDLVSFSFLIKEKKIEKGQK